MTWQFVNNSQRIFHVAHLNYRGTLKIPLFQKNHVEDSSKLGLVWFYLASILLHPVTMDLSKIIQVVYNINYNPQ
jgi:hypothetical protein